ncbi:alkaline shock response membrane anchor protein AmaP [Nocardiopsis suaedae]|uniref:Alkaline shock response membrane anchor protein AmaP n=1 Tax=Nocardiopsis suaedae TaxID=3018444 RepID=A0ABT4TG92_9ACTN|nr:alkaline shock response membrane anchor protein AmaP [Nocardiopsis suaedae]MDA2803732.1 alkaline shock response membrane anchor protein AmaP [Nocardiopsis suaedae]
MGWVNGARRTARGNRWGLALVGLVLAAAGGGALAVGLGAFGAGAAGTVLGAGPEAAGLPSPGWLPYAVAAVAVVVALLALRWLFVQGRVERVRRLTVEPEEGAGRSELVSGAAQGAVEEAVGAVSGVRRARARLLGSDRAPRLRLDVVVDDDADVAEVWSGVRGESLSDLRGALETDRLPTVVRISMAAPKRNRARVA